MPRSRSRTQNHIEISCINGTVVYRVDNPRTGCSAGFWATRLPGTRETRFELDFQHAPQERCRCLGRDTDAPAVRALLQLAFELVDSSQQQQQQQDVTMGVGIHHEAGSAVAAMLVFLKRALRLKALGEAELDLWDKVRWPPRVGGEYYSCESEDELLLLDGRKRKRGRSYTRCGGERRRNKLQKKQKQPERRSMTPPEMQPTGDRGQAHSGGGKSLSPWRRAWIEFSFRIGVR